MHNFQREQIRDQQPQLTNQVELLSRTLKQALTADTFPTTTMGRKSANANHLILKEDQQMADPIMVQIITPVTAAGTTVIATVVAAFVANALTAILMTAIAVVVSVVNV